MYSVHTVLHIRKAAFHLLWKIDFTMGNRFYHDDASMTKSYINVLFHARALPNGEKMDVVPATVLHLLKALSALFDENSRSYLGHLNTTEAHMRHMRSTDAASISKTTKVALNTAMHLPKKNL